MTALTGRLITVSATYGSGGSVVAPALAERLAVPYLQRLTTSGGAFVEAATSRERLSAGEERATPVHHLLASLSHALPAGPTQSPAAPHAHHKVMRREAEADIRRLAARGEGVILGRGAAVVLGKDCGAFHVRLDGPREERIVRGAEIEGISPEEARDHLRAADKARAAYVRRLYSVDPADASIYHLVLDSTVMSIDVVVKLILFAVREAARAPAAADRRG